MRLVATGILPLASSSGCAERLGRAANAHEARARVLESRNSYQEALREREVADDVRQADVWSKERDLLPPLGLYR